MSRRAKKKTGTRDRVESTRAKYRGSRAAELAVLDRLRVRYEQGLMRLCGAVAGSLKGKQRRTGVERERKTPFAKMLSGGHIDMRQFAAGERLRSDWLTIVLRGSGSDFTSRAMIITGEPVEFIMVDVEYELENGEMGVKKQRRPVTFRPHKPKKVRGGVRNRSDYAMEASDRLRQAANALPGNLYDLLVEVCGQECTLRDLYGGPWGGRVATTRKFKKALDLLGDHYGLPSIYQGNKVEAVGYNGYRGSFDPTDQGYEEACRVL